MESVPLVSVIVPAYGHSKQILHALDSVFAQTFQDYELIVVNDGSPDNTEEVLGDLIRQNRIHYVSQKNQGVAAARNHGIRLARGRYIALLDDDDYWPIDKLEWQVEVLEKDGINAVAVGGLADFVHDDSGLVDYSETMHENIIDYASLFDGCPFISPGSVMIRREAMVTVGGFNEDLWGADDFDLWFRLTSIGQVLRHPRTSLYYRWHASNASSNSLRMMVNCRKVIDQRLSVYRGEEFKKNRRRAYSFLFRWRGQLCLREWAGALLHIPPDTRILRLHGVGLFQCFWRIMLTDCELRRLLYQELGSCLRIGAGKSIKIGRNRDRASA